MPNPLTHPDRVILREALAATPQFSTVRGRQTIIGHAIDGYPLSGEINQALGWLDWEGPPTVVASELIQHLEGHEAAPGVPALAPIAQTIESAAGLAHREKIADLRHRMGWGSVVPPAVPPTSGLVQELIIGEDTLRHIYYLRRALLAADAVVRIMHGDTNGSGFLVGPELMMTNHHVIRNQEQARGCEACFFDEMPDHEYREKLEKEPVMVRTAGENPLLYTNEHLDVSLVRLHNSPRLSRYLPLRRALVKQNDRVVIIQHPLGGTKRIALQNNLVAEANTRIVQYYTPTMRGSSGSPVLNDDFAVVAIHHSSDADSTWDGGGQIRFTNPDENQNRQYRNQGTSMIALLEDLEKIAASSLLAELTILPG